jgi:PAS domain S-box-containing protein
VNDCPSPDAAELRRRAEKTFRDKAAQSPDRDDALSPEEMQRTLHELRVHRIELEMQNEELHRSQLELEAAKSRYFDLYNLAPVGYFTLSEQGLILEANLTAIVLLGMTRTALVGQPITRFILPDDQDIYYLHRKQLFDTAKPQRCELRMVTTDEATLWAHLTSTAARDAGGAPVCRVAISDITERKQAEASLKASEEKFSKIFHNSPVMLSLSTLEEGRYIDANDAFVSTSGFTREEILRGTIPSIGLIGAPDLQKLMARLRSDRRVSGFEMVLMAKGGREIQCLFNAEIVQIQGRPCLLSVALDVTEVKTLHYQFIQAQKMEAVGQLAGGVAHDFNNILSVMLMHLHLIKINKSSEYLAELEDEVKSAASLTRQLLIFSRKEAMQIKPLQLNEIIRNLIKMLQRLLEENITIDLRLAPELPLVPADAGMMEQVLTNLCLNARDAMLRGGILLITTEVVDLADADPQTGASHPPGRYVKLTVADTGCGIEDCILSRIFDPFFTTKEAGKGTGLGLATTQDIVKQHGGWISVTSKWGVGSAFIVHMPAAESPALQTPASRSRDDSLAGGNETILLAEDDYNVRRITSKTLRFYGYAVLEAVDGQSALAVWKEKKDQINLLMTDIVMPGGMSGLELAATCREVNPSLKTLITTGYALETSVEKIEAQAGFAVLKKPYEVSALVAAVRHCLDGDAEKP